MCSQTPLRPPGFSHSYYVPLQLLQTAFVSPMPLLTIDAARPVAAEVLVLTYSQEHPQLFPGKTLVLNTNATESCCTCLVVTAALSWGSQVLYSEHSPAPKNLSQQKF